MEFFSFFSWLYWDPPRQAFTLPYLNHPVAWYGILFVIGFISGYFVILSIFDRFLKEEGEPNSSSVCKFFSNRKEMTYFLADRLCWFAIAGTIIGARLGEVLFYRGPYFENPLEIFKIWQGGLASHGGVLGVLVALYFYLKYVHRWIFQLTYLKLLDFVSIPSALVACLIRLGNFVNQEILGTATTYPWAVIFGHPADGSRPLARHPVQLYEAGAYLISFIILHYLWKNQKSHAHPGFIIGWMFILIFGSRFVLEFFKMTQDSFFNLSFLQAGQVLSLPFLFLGIALIVYSRFEKLAFR